MQRFLRREDVEHITGLPTSTIYELMSRGTFPKPIQITPRRVAWLESEIVDWQKACIAAARPEAA
jgi:prophage regulatory protein